MAGPALPLVLTLPAEATAVEAMVGEAVAAEAISGRRYFTRTGMAVGLFPKLF